MKELDTLKNIQKREREALRLAEMYSKEQDLKKKRLLKYRIEWQIEGMLITTRFFNLKPKDNEYFSYKEIRDIGSVYDPDEYDTIGNYFNRELFCSNFRTLEPLNQTTI